MIILAIDTAANLCAACILDSARDVELGRAVRDIGKGHAEMLMDVIGEALAASGVGYPDIEGVAVSVGPGSFTGIRVGVAAARGLALALGIPSTGVTTLDALTEVARSDFPGRPVMAAIDARRGAVYHAALDADGRSLAEPAIVALEQAADLAKARKAVLAGSAADALAKAAETDFDIATTRATADIAVYARLGARAGFSGDKPKPLYLRPADAKPQQGFALARKDA